MPTEYRTSEQLARPHDGEMHDRSLSDNDWSLSDNDFSPGIFRFALAILAGLMVVAIAGAFVE